MKTIWKYPLNADETVIDLPVGAKVLTVQMQGETACLWALVAQNAPREKRRFTFYGTGHNAPAAVKSYIGTIQIERLGLVFHLFETTNIN